MKIFNIVILTILLVLSLKTTAQNNSKFGLIVGANVCNPNQLIEGSETIDDFKQVKPYGNMFVAISYKNRYVIGFGKELNEYTFYSRYPKDFYGFVRLVLLKDTARFKPYIEFGYILNTYGNDRFNYKSQNSYMYGIGVIYKLNKIISLDLGLGMQHREMDLESRLSWDKDQTKITLDRFMFKTGLIFKVL